MTGFRPRHGALLLLALAATACAPKPPPTPAPAPAQASLPVGGMCKIEGCCTGHGTVAYVQSDEIIMCTDGRPSEICDCH